MGDFLRKNESTPYTQSFLVAGAPFRISTNFRPILEIAQQTFWRAHTPEIEPAFSIRLWVDRHGESAPPWPQPYLRGNRTLVYASFAPGNFLLVDLASRRIVGRLSPQMAADCGHWTRIIFPMLMSIIAGSIGLAEVHCACVARNGRGMLLAGPTRSGKSTLAVALGLLGLDVVSDDRTFCAVRGNLVAWAPLADFKLRKDAVRWFPDLDPEASTPEGAEGLRFAPESVPFLNRLQQCEPRALIFLEPRSRRFQLTGISPEEARARLMSELAPDEVDEAERERVLSALSELPAARLHYAQDPLTVARELASQFEDFEAKQQGLRTPSRAAAKARVAVDLPHPQRAASDPLRRFLPAEHQAVLSVMGKTLRLETNSPVVLDHARQLVSVYPVSSNPDPDFHWRIMVQPETDREPPEYTRFAFSDPGLRFCQLGHRCFLGVDIHRRQAFAFLNERTAADKLRFAYPFLDTLFCLCAASLGFLPLYSNCVARNGKGILLLGAPAAGKTTASYLAAKRGLTLHADDGVFVERTEQGELRAWGGFWPVIFRREAAQLFPELPTCGQSDSYHHFAYYYLEKEHFQTTLSEAVVPVASAILRRGSGVGVQIARLDRAARSRRVAKSLLFEEEKRFRLQQAAIQRKLVELPSYDLEYGPDSGAAVDALGELLARHSNC